MIYKMMLMDWRAMKYYQVRLALVPLFLFFIGLASPLIIVPFGMYLALSYSVNTFAIEEKGDLNLLYLTLPVNRNNVVAGRFCLSILFGGLGLLMSIPVAFISNLIGPSHYYLNIEQNLFVLAISCFIFSISNLFMFPTLFKLGYQKGKLLGFYVPAITISILCTGGMTLMSMTNINFISIAYNFGTNNLMLINWSILLLSAVILFISYSLSKAIYNKRDF